MISSSDAGPIADGGVFEWSFSDTDDDELDFAVVAVLLPAMSAAGVLAEALLFSVDEVTEEEEVR